MKKATSRIAIAMAAAIMAFAPIAANAGTRAGDNAAVYSTAQPGLSQSAQGEDLVNRSGGILLLLLGGAAIIAGIIIAADSGDNQSPGAN